MHSLFVPRAQKLKPIAAALLALGLATQTAQVHAAQFTVTTNADSGTGSLRDAVLQANASAGPDTVVFAPGVTNVLLASQIDVTGVLTITGNGTAATVISGNNVTRIFNATADLTLNALTLTNGSTSGNGGAVNVQAYGGVSLTLSQVLVQNNTASSRGGGIFYEAYGGGNFSVSDSTFIGNTATNGQGGGLYVRGGYGGASISIVRSRFHSNSSSYGGAAATVSGAYGGSILLDQLVVTSNNVTTSGAYGGGAIELNDPEAPDARIARSYFANNTSGNVGGALVVTGNDDTVIVENNTFVSNTAAYGGGAVYLNPQVDPITFRHNTVVNNTSNSGAVLITSSSTGVVLENSIIIGNQGPGDADVTVESTSPTKAARVRTAKDFSAGSTPLQPAALSSASNTIVGSGTGGTSAFPAANGNQYGVTLASVALGAAAANGATPVGAPGSTATPLSLLPGPGSIAIDRGGASAVTVDQLGNPRPQPARPGAASLPDIGAIEVATAAAPVAVAQPVPASGAIGLGVFAAAIAALGAIGSRRRHRRETRD